MSSTTPASITSIDRIVAAAFPLDPSIQPTIIPNDTYAHLSHHTITQQPLPSNPAAFHHLVGGRRSMLLRFCCVRRRVPSLTALVLVVTLAATTVATATALSAGNKKISLRMQ